VSSLDLSISAYGRLILRVVVDGNPRKDGWLDGGPLTAANSIKTPYATKKFNLNVQRSARIRNSCVHSC
jgi:hypothetical protein